MPDRSRLHALSALVAGLVLALVAGCGGTPYLEARLEPRAPEAPATVEHGSELFAGSDGTTLFGQWWRPREAAPPRAVLILVHGLKDHSNRYVELASALVARGIAVYALDLRGHGHSAGQRASISDFEDVLRDLDVFVSRVRAREAGAPTFVFGHSMGGAIATLWTIERRPPVAGLVLSGAALEAGVPGTKIFATRALALFAPGAKVFQLDLEDFSRDPQVVRDAATDPLVYQDPAPARTARELLGAIGMIQDRMGEIAVPLLVMHGAADKVTPPEGSRELARRAATLDKTLVIFPGLVHDLLHEPERAQVVDAVVRWVDERAPARRALAAEAPAAPVPPVAPVGPAASPPAP